MMPFSSHMMEIGIGAGIIGFALIVSGVCVCASSVAAYYILGW